MSKFVKRNTIVKVEIGSYIKEADFGRDEIPSVFRSVLEGIEEIEDKYSNKPVKDGMRLIQNEEKALFKSAINEILEDEYASSEIFENDDSAVYHADVYTYISELYKEVMMDKIPQYSANRAQRRAEK